MKKKEAARTKHIPFIVRSLARSFVRSFARGCDAHAQFSTPSADSSPYLFPRTSRQPLVTHVHRLEPAPRVPTRLCRPRSLPPVYFSSLFLSLRRCCWSWGRVLGSRHGGRDDSRQVPSAAESRARRADENERAAVNGRASERVRVRITHKDYPLLLSLLLPLLLILSPLPLLIGENPQ